MFRFLVLFLVLSVSCSKVQQGKDGRNGASGESGLVGPAGNDGNNGRDYYSYMLNVNIQEIVGDGRDEEVIINDSDIYQLPKTFQVTVDNSYPDCELRDFSIIIETDSGDERFTFQPTENRYVMSLKSGPVNKVVDSSQIRVYYESMPEVDCGSTIYRLHSGVQFEIRVIKELEVE